MSSLLRIIDLGNLGMDLTGVEPLWCALPQLFFHCTLCPTGSLGSQSRQSQHKEVEGTMILVSSSEPIKLTQKTIIHHIKVCMFRVYDTTSSSNFQCLCICWAKNVLGREH